jgi:two-component system cell cycle response regulator
LRVTASVGIAALGDEGDTLEMLFERADKALYVAKRDGRNRVVADAA